jgi:hypothetical protein
MDAFNVVLEGSYFCTTRLLHLTLIRPTRRVIDVVRLTPTHHRNGASFEMWL